MNNKKTEDQFDPKELIQELSPEYQEGVIEEYSFDNTHLAISDYLTDEGCVYVFQYQDGYWKYPTVIYSDPSKQEVKFGKDLHFNEDGRYIAIQSESAIDFKGKKINSPISIFKKDQTGHYTRISFIHPKYQETGSDYGAVIFLSLDGQTLFVSAPNKINDHTTECEGSTGAVYVFHYDINYRRHKQHMLIRPPFEGIKGFGEFLNIENDEFLYVEDTTGRCFLYENIEEEWVFKEEVFD